MESTRRRAGWRSSGVALMLALTAGLAVANEASATTIGRTGGGLDCVGLSFILGDTSYVVPAGGGPITSFSFRSTAANAGQQVDFLVLHPVGGGNYTVVGKTGLVALAGAGADETFTPPTPIAAQAGDILGLFESGLRNCVRAGGTGQINSFGSASDPSVGATVALPNSFVRSLNESADLLNRADLSLTKLASPSPDVQHDQSVTYTLTVANAGPNAADSPTITDTLPAGQTFVAAGSSPGCSAVGQTVTCTTADLANHASAAVTIIARAGTVGADQTNTATVSSTTDDPKAADNTATATVKVVPSADLSLTKTSSPNPVIAGQQLTYTLVARNAGPDTAVNVKILDVLPPGALFQKEGTGAGEASCTAAGRTVTCLLGDIPAGQSRTVMILVLPTSPSALNNATVSSNTADPDSDNTATNTTAVTPSCNDTRTGRLRGAIIVHAGQFLCLKNATLTGAILVDPGGALTATNSTIKGAIRSDGAQFITICASTINSTGGVIIKNTRLLVRVADDNSPCAPNHITGALLINANKGGVEIFANTITGSLSVTGNRGASPIADGIPEVEGNHIGGALKCAANHPPPTNDAQRNTTRGAKLGECANL